MAVRGVVLLENWLRSAQQQKSKGTKRCAHCWALWAEGWSPLLKGLCSAIAAECSTAAKSLKAHGKKTMCKPRLARGREHAHASLSTSPRLQWRAGRSQCGTSKQVRQPGLAEFAALAQSGCKLGRQARLSLPAMQPAFHSATPDQACGQC